MAKGQMRSAKEKKKPKADKDKPKQLSAYKLAQMQGSSSSPYSTPPGARSPDGQRRPTVPIFESAGSSLACLAISRQVSNST